jgi:hypothetical protein
MKRSFVLSVVIICFVLTLGTFSTAKADTVLFPVIATNYPYVTTIVSVINRGGSSYYTSSHLRYVYSYKYASSSYSSGCYGTSVVRPTWAPDLVSFDASGTFNGGWAMFNDPDSYGGSFAVLPSGAVRSYLLVTHSDAFGNRADVGYDWALGGEAIIMDIFYGAAWGYKAVNDGNREDYSFYSSGISNVMLVGDGRRFTFFPPSEWTTRFFVTPIGSNMNSIDLNSTVRITGFEGSLLGSITGRGSTTYNFNVSQLVNCLAAVNLSDLMDSTAWAGIYYTGGWGWFNNVSGNPALVYKLEYVVNNYTYGGTNNNAYLLSTVDGP